jgi:hypothetical protein
MRDYLPFPAMGMLDNLNLGGTTKALRLSSLQLEERRFLVLSYIYFLFGIAALLLILVDDSFQLT